MKDEPRRKLAEMIVKHGRSICEQKITCKGFILDYCHGYDKEVRIFVMLLETDIPAELLNTSSGTSTALLLDRLTRKACDILSMEKEAARWGVEAWARALGISVPTSTPVVRPPTPPPTVPVSVPRSSTTLWVPTSTSVVRSPIPPPTTPVSVPRPPTPLWVPTSTSTSVVRPPTPPQRQISRPPAAVYRPPRHRQSNFFADLLAVGFGVFLMILGARTFVFLHISSDPPSLDLFPYILFFLAAMLGPKRGLLAALFFLGLGILGLPLFSNGSEIWSLSSFLVFVGGEGGSIYLKVPYYYVSIVILLLLGSIFRSRGRGNFIGTIGLILLGQVMYMIYIIAISLVIYHLSLSAAFSYQVHSLVAMLLLGVFFAIPTSLVRKPYWA